MSQGVDGHRAREPSLLTKLTAGIGQSESAPGAGKDLSGWVEAFLFVVAISALNIVYALAQQLGAHVVVFVLFATAFAAVGMLSLTGLGADAKDVIMAPQSWLFGGATVAMEGFYFLLLGVVTPAEASLLVRLSVPVSIIAGCFVFGRGLSAMTIVGMAIVVASVIPILFAIEDERVITALILTLICSIIVTLKTFSSEFHPWNRNAKSLSEKLRVTGLVVLATAMLGAGVFLPAIALTAAGILPESELVPKPEALLHWPTLVLAILVGAPVLFAMNFLTFSSVVKITTENFLAVTAFTPVVALALQSIAVALGVIDAPPLDWWLLPTIIVGVAGVLLILRSRR